MKRNVGRKYHNAGSEPYFFDTTHTYTKQLDAISVDFNGSVCSGRGDREHRMCPTEMKSVPAKMLHALFVDSFSCRCWIMWTWGRGGGGGGGRVGF